MQIVMINQLNLNLRQSVNSVLRFSDPNFCEEFLRNEINDKQKIFLIVLDTLDGIFLPRIDQSIQLMHFVKIKFVRNFSQINIQN